MVRQCHRMARLADRWRITIHMMPFIVCATGSYQDCKLHSCNEL